MDLGRHYLIICSNLFLFCNDASNICYCMTSVCFVRTSFNKIFNLKYFFIISLFYYHLIACTDKMFLKSSLLFIIVIKWF